MSIINSLKKIFQEQKDIPYLFIHDSGNHMHSGNKETLIQLQLEYPELQFIFMGDYPQDYLFPDVNSDYDVRKESPVVPDFAIKAIKKALNPFPKGSSDYNILPSGFIQYNYAAKGMAQQFIDFIDKYRLKNYAILIQGSFDPNRNVSPIYYNVPMLKGRKLSTPQINKEEIKWIKKTLNL